MHQWTGTAFTAHSIGHKGMLYASKVISTTVIDYVLHPPWQRSIRSDFELNTGSLPYKSLIT